MSERDVMVGLPMHCSEVAERGKQNGMVCTHVPDVDYFWKVADNIGGC